MALSFVGRNSGELYALGVEGQQKTGRIVSAIAASIPSAPSWFDGRLRRFAAQAAHHEGYEREGVEERPHGAQRTGRSPDRARRTTRPRAHSSKPRNAAIQTRQATARETQPALMVDWLGRAWSAASGVGAWRDVCSR